MNEFTVKHYQPVTGRWHVEDGGSWDGPHPIWTTDLETATLLVQGYQNYGIKAEVVKAADITVEPLSSVSKSLVLVEETEFSLVSLVTCGECGVIVTDETSTFNTDHSRSCSLHPENVV